MRRARRAAIVLALAGIAATFPTATFAADGQVLNSGSDIAGDVSIVGGFPSLPQASPASPARRTSGRRRGACRILDLVRGLGVGSYFAPA
jgi:hypothetical protein